MKTASLGQVAEFVNGVAFKPEDWSETGLPIVRIQNLTDPSKPINLTTRSVPDRFHVRQGDLLVSWSATLGVFEWRRTQEALVNQHIFRVLPHSALVAKNYLRHMLRGALRAMERHLHGATMQHVNRNEFLSTEIPLPTLEEQRRIAAILDQADALRTTHRQVLAHFDGLEASVFESMFSNCLDVVPNEMPLQSVLFAIENGTSPVCESRPAEFEEWGVLKLGAVTYGTFRAGENKAYLGPLAGMNRNEVRSGDVLMTRKNTRELVGAVAVVGQTRPRLLIPDLVFRLRLNAEKIDATYFQAFMMSPKIRETVRGLSSGSAASMPNISKARLSQLSIRVPPLDLQFEFADRRRSIDLQRAIVERELAAVDTLIESLQHRAFRGEL